MKKNIILLTALLLIGCGTLKKDKSSEETETKTDLNASKIDKSNEIGGSIVLRPFNPQKPIINGKDTIHNATIEKHYYTKERIVKDTISKKEESKTDINTKNVERDNTELFRGIAREFFILLAVLFLINLAYKHFTKKPLL